jgi:hypothetical protein
MDDSRQTVVCTPLIPSQRVANVLFVHSRLLLRIMKGFTAEPIGTFFIIVGNPVECHSVPVFYETCHHTVLCD